MSKKRTWVVAIVLSVAAGIFALQNVSAPSSGADEIQATFFTEVAVETPTPSATYEGCGYMWAYHDDPQLSSRINQAVQAIDPDASARVQLFGEDCVYADGHATFSTMETDFHVQFPADERTTEEQLGNWMQQVMDLIVALPAEEIAGHKGFVEFSFTKSEADPTMLRVVIADYTNLTTQPTGAGLFKQFYTPRPTPSTPIPSTSTP